MIGAGCLPLALFLFLLLLLPVLFGQVMAEALLKLDLAPTTAVLLAIGIIGGSGINIPVTCVMRDKDVVVHPLAIFGLPHLWPAWQRIRRETIIAVNVGGCIIPGSIAVYEAVRLARLGWPAVGALALAVALTSAVCYAVARPVQGVGIAMPGLLPPVVAVVAALLFAPDQRVPVAFTAGVLGPLIGADILHLREIPWIATGLASIGGAGTFDGIVLSGIVAAYLA